MTAIPVLPVFRGPRRHSFFTDTDLQDGGNVRAVPSPRGRSLEDFLRESVSVQSENSVRCLRIHFPRIQGSRRAVLEGMVTHSVQDTQQRCFVSARHLQFGAVLAAGA